jgi:hypothetical protein
MYATVYLLLVCGVIELNAQVDHAYLFEKDFNFDPEFDIDGGLKGRMVLRFF